MKLKEIINESIIEDIVTSIFLAVHKNKINDTFKKVSNDPKLKVAIDNFRNSLDDLKDYIKKNK